jgi:NADPH:quinone reductase-like Zn-dependent oxidoreductase
MNAIVLRELGQAAHVLRLEHVPDPAPGPGQAVVRLKAAALNHRDSWIRRGLYAGIKLPVILGSDGAGIVEAVGAGADKAWLARDVVINPSLDWGTDARAQGPRFRILGLPDDGTYAERVVVPMANLHVKPEALTWEEAAAIPLAGLTAYRALVTRARVQPGETVLVTGVGGGVATFALLFALRLGARVIVTSGSDEKIARAKALGAAAGVNYHEDGWGKAVQALCDGGPDVIIDSAGHQAFPTLLDVAKPGARIVTFGSTTGSPTTLEIRKIFWKQLSILGSTMGTPDEFEAMLRIFGDGSVRPVVDRVFPLTEAALAHERMDDAGQFGKLVLSIA